MQKQQRGGDAVALGGADAVALNIINLLTF